MFVKMILSIRLVNQTLTRFLGAMTRNYHYFFLHSPSLLPVIVAER